MIMVGVLWYQGMGVTTKADGVGSKDIKVTARPIMAMMAASVESAGGGGDGHDDGSGFESRIRGEAVDGWLGWTRGPRRQRRVKFLRNTVFG